MKKIIAMLIFLMGILSCSCEQQVDRKNDEISIVESTTIQEEKTLIKEREECTMKREKQKNIWTDKTTLSVVVRYAKDDEELFRETKGTMIIRMNKDKGSFMLYLSTKDKEFSDKKISTFIIKSNKIYEKNEKKYLVFQKKSEVFDENAGEEMRIRHKKNKIIFNRVNNNVESGFNEYIEFSKEGNILCYRTQYGVGRDFFEISVLDN